LAAAGDDHSVHLWRMDNGQRFATLHGHDDWVRSVVFTPDGNSLITAGDDGRVLRWNVQQPNQPAIEIYRQEPTLFDVAVSPRGDHLFCVGFDSKLRIVSLNTGRIEVERSCSCQDVRAIAVSPDGQHAASGGRDGVIHLWSLPGCRCERDIDAHTRRIRSLTFSRDGHWLISAGEDRSIVVTNVDDGAHVMRLSSGPAKVLAIAICGDHILASAGSDNLIRLWDLNKRTQLGRLNGHTGSVAALASNEEMLVSGSFDTTVRVWQISEAVKELQARRKQEDKPAVR
jgi:WD40 repeat protein